MEDSISQALQGDGNKQVVFMEQDEFNRVCEDDAGNFIDKRYCEAGWAKNIRREYCEMVYNACAENLNRDEGIFSVDGADMDLAQNVGKFFHKHPHTEYCCPASWRESVLKKLKENFTEAATRIRDGLNGPKVLEDEDGVIPAPEDEVINDEPSNPKVKPTAKKSPYNPNQSVVQTLHDVSNRVWSAWRVMSDLASTQLVNRVNMGDLDEKEFSGVLKLRDNLRKIASEADDLALQFRIVKKEEEEEDEDR